MLVLIKLLQFFIKGLDEKVLAGELEVVCRVISVHRREITEYSLIQTSFKILRDCNQLLLVQLAFIDVQRLDLEIQDIFEYELQVIPAL